ncbi:MAG: LTA synthase family protein, partial [Candidatus Electrothrix sp. EH2]|nr:LTA synthase family protein [Candidatus Electrothrix sp. EH2]
MPVFLLFQACAALIAAFLFSSYTVAATESRWTSLMFLDTLSLAALFYLFFQAVTRIQSIKGRIAVTACISIVISLTFIGNVFYYQVFHDWVHAELFGQWGVGLSIQGSVFENASWREISLALFVPLILFLFAVLWRDRAKKYTKRAALLMLLLCLSAHSAAVSEHFEPSEHNFFVNLTRELVVKILFPAGKAMRGNIDPSLYPPADPSRYIVSTDRHYPLIKIPKEKSQGSSLFPQGKQPNVVLILMESVRAKESGAYGAKQSFTPAFDRLAQQGLLYKNFYANGTQTVRAELSLLCSFYPNFTGTPIYMKRPKLRLSSLPGILKDDGYRTLWISGFKASYANKDGFLRKHGIEELYDGSDLDPDSTEKIGWGYSDRAIFSYAEAILDKQQEPFFAEIMTLSNHWPFDFPYSETPKILPETADNKYSNYCRGIYYTDWAMGEFMKRMRKKSYFNNTLFIITADHGIWYFPPEEKLSTVEKQEAYFRMPLLFYAPAVLAPKVSDIVTSQIDVAPTVLDLLGIQ